MRPKRNVPTTPRKAKDNLDNPMPKSPGFNHFKFNLFGLFVKKYRPKSRDTFKKISIVAIICLRKYGIARDSNFREDI